MAAAILAACLGFTGSARAAVLTGSVSTAPPATANLTATGTVDWAIWDYRLGGEGTSGAPSNRKSGGSAISSITAALGTPRGITGTTSPPTYSYADGTSPAAATNATIGAITDNSLNTVGSGFRFTVTGSPARTDVVQVFVAGFNSVGTFTAQLNGATTYTDSTPSYNVARSGALYTLTFRPDALTDVLRITYTISALNPGGNANVDLQAVTVGVPEPAAAGLAVAGASLLLRRGRRAQV